MDFEGAKQFIVQKLQKELSAELTYHSVGHTMDVFDVTGQLATLEGIEGEELTLLLTAVLFHDSGFLIGPQGHEAISCDYAMEYLPAFGYTPEQLRIICGMIMATRLPQTPYNLLEQIICDADLDYLGRSDFWTIGDGLFRELKVSGFVTNQREWDEKQVLFLEQHHYFTQSAIRLRKATKDAHLAELKSRLLAS